VPIIDDPTDRAQLRRALESAVRGAARRRLPTTRAPVTPPLGVVRAALTAAKPQMWLATQLDTARRVHRIGSARR
jgi:hypothetical protein